MRYFGRLLWLAFTIVTVVFAMAFATSNAGSLTLYLWPFQSSISGPIWLFMLGGVGLGTLFGGVTVWFSFLAIRTRHWRLRKRMAKTERRASEAEEKLAAISSDDTKQISTTQ